MEFTRQTDTHPVKPRNHAGLQNYHIMETCQVYTAKHQDYNITVYLANETPIEQFETTSHQDTAAQFLAIIEPPTLPNTLKLKQPDCWTLSGMPTLKLWIIEYNGKFKGCYEEEINWQLALGSLLHALTIKELTEVN